MNVSDIMSRNVLTVAEDTPVSRVVQLLIDHGISAVPVTRDGELVGIVSESDLVTGGRRATMDRAAWFSLLIDGRSEQPVKSGRFASDVMTTPVVSIGEHASLAEAVRLMQVERIKRLPVTRAGKLVGLLARADLLRSLLTGAGAAGRAPDAGVNPLTDIDDQFARDHQPPATFQPQAANPPAPTLTAADFRHTVEEAKEREVAHAAEEARLAAARHAHDIEMFRDEHITENFWRLMLINARHAAERGEKELQILRFPREVCSDGGRMINAADPDWPSSLHGQAAEVFHRWSADLRPRGFRLSARTLEYPGGLPGDVGLFLVWGG